MDGPQEKGAKTAGQRASGPQPTHARLDAFCQARGYQRRGRFWLDLEEEEPLRGLSLLAVLRSLEVGAVCAVLEDVESGTPASATAPSRTTMVASCWYISVSWVM